MTGGEVPIGDGLLPPAFGDLEPFCATWAMATTDERHVRRVSSTMDELTAFYDVAAPRLEDALEHLDRYPLDDLPEPEARLLRLCLSLADVALAVEKYGSPFLAEAPCSTAFAVDTSALG